jgi:hypothetical protein
MVSKTIKIRKDHKCSICGKVIKRGEMVEYYETRYPNYCYITDVQTGIKYIKLWDHIECRAGLPF